MTHELQSFKYCLRIESNDFIDFHESWDELLKFKIKCLNFLSNHVKN